MHEFVCVSYILVTHLQFVRDTQGSTWIDIEVINHKDIDMEVDAASH